jgi:hypothetical protein
MAQEISLSLAITVSKPSVMPNPVVFARINQFTMTGNLFIQGDVSVGITATAIPLASVTAPHWSFFYNTDATNFLTIRNGSGGADLLKILPGEFCVVPLLDTSVPFAIANTAPCVLAYGIFTL